MTTTTALSVMAVCAVVHTAAYCFHLLTMQVHEWRQSKAFRAFSRHLQARRAHEGHDDGESWKHGRDEEEDE